MKCLTMMVIRFGREDLSSRVNSIYFFSSFRLVLYRVVFQLEIRNATVQEGKGIACDKRSFASGYECSQRFWFIHS